MFVSDILSPIYVRLGFPFAALSILSKGGFVMPNFLEGYGFAELLNFSPMVAPEVMALENGGFFVYFWLTDTDIESSTVQELEHLSEMMSRAIGKLDVR